MNKFQSIIPEIIDAFSLFKEVLSVILYGSVSRGDYSERHSDMDLFIVINRKMVNSRLKELIEKKISSIGIKNGVNIHMEFQPILISEDDHTLLRKIIEEGKVIYSSGMWVVQSGKLGLSMYNLCEYSTESAEQKTRTKLTQILHGRKFPKGNIQGIIDNETIISVGRGVLIIRADRAKEIETLFARINVPLRTNKIIFF
ncbi:MAG: nucleotidyltransferase domain-containing protein [Nanoarchaeota archaeon]